MSLTFQAEGHEYRWDGRRVPSVTQVIGAAGCAPHFNAGAWYMERGVALHAAAALWDEGDLDEKSIDPAIAGHLAAYIDFRKMVGADLEIIEIERPRYHALLGYAGTPDRVALWREKRTVIDLKSGSRAAWHAVQAWGYRGLVEGSQVGLGLYLAEDSTWKMEKFDDRNDRAAFEAAVSLWKWRETHGCLS